MDWQVRSTSRSIGLRVRRQYSGDVRRKYERRDYCGGCWQADLKARSRGDVASLARGQKVLVRGAGFSRISELTEADFPLRCACLESERGETHSRDGSVACGLEKRGRAQHRPLVTDPRSTAAHLSVWTALQKRLHRLADGREDIFRRVKADAADKVDLPSHV